MSARADIVDRFVTELAAESVASPAAWVGVNLESQTAALGGDCVVMLGGDTGDPVRIGETQRRVLDVECLLRANGPTTEAAVMAYIFAQEILVVQGAMRVANLAASVAVRWSETEAPEIDARADLCAAMMSVRFRVEYAVLPTAAGVIL